MTMDYEKKYKELIEKIELISHSALTVEQHQIIDTILGELKESEDEKVRKALVEMVHDTTGDELWVDYNVHKEEALAWLEKQGEQKPFDYENANIQQRDWAEIPFGAKDSELQEATYLIPEGFHAEIKGNEVFIKKGEQRTAWSEEDEVKINRIAACLENLKVADNDILLKDVDWLKSLKPQSHWKPSDEQLEALKNAIHIKPFESPSDNLLWGLYVQLKKLREE